MEGRGQVGGGEQREEEGGGRHRCGIEGRPRRLHVEVEIHELLPRPRHRWRLAGVGLRHVVGGGVGGGGGSGGGEMGGKGLN